MKKNLKVALASDVVTMSGCSKAAEWACGIMYRQS